MAALQKIYPCLSCGQEIRLERKDAKWLRWNLDGTPHVDQKNNKKQQPTITTSASTTAAAAAQPTVPVPGTESVLERKLDHLIAEVQALRMELQKKK